MDALLDELCCKTISWLLSNLIIELDITMDLMVYRIGMF